MTDAYFYSNITWFWLQMPFFFFLKQYPRMTNVYSSSKCFPLFLLSYSTVVLYCLSLCVIVEQFTVVPTEGISFPKVIILCVSKVLDVAVTERLLIHKPCKYINPSGACMTAVISHNSFVLHLHAKIYTSLAASRELLWMLQV